MKRKVERCGRWDGLAPEHSILASNTSGLSIAAMAPTTTRPEKVIGWHWSSPAQVMAMAEIVVAPGTSEETRDAVVELARLFSTNPVVVRYNPATWRTAGPLVYAAPPPHPT